MTIAGIEHLGLVITDPAAAAIWYRDHLGFTVLQVADDGAVAFLRDPATGLVIECIAAGRIAAHHQTLTDPLQVHLAITSDDYEADRARLIAAGATHCVDCTTPDPAAKVCILQDPFGVHLQLAQRRFAFAR